MIHGTKKPKACEAWVYGKKCKYLLHRQTKGGKTLTPRTCYRLKGLEAPETEKHPRLYCSLHDPSKRMLTVDSGQAGRAAAPGLKIAPKGLDHPLASKLEHQAPHNLNSSPGPESAFSTSHGMSDDRRPSYAAFGHDAQQSYGRLASPCTTQLSFGYAGYEIQTPYGYPDESAHMYNEQIAYDHDPKQSAGNEAAIRPQSIACIAGQIDRQSYGRSPVDQQGLPFEPLDDILRDASLSSPLPTPMETNPRYLPAENHELITRGMEQLTFATAGAEIACAPATRYVYGDNQGQTPSYRVQKHSHRSRGL